jgi:hypothetical protein
VQEDSSTTVLTLIESRYDWITATAKKDGKGGELFDFGMAQMTADAEAGNQQRAWYFQGYSGVHAGNWSVGWGREGAIVVATQEGSEIGYRSLAGLADHWSRCDLCVTGISSQPDYSPVLDYWERVKPGVKRSEKAPICTVLLNSKGGATFYQGQRSAAFYMRVYNKHVESEGEYPPGSWRFELELKRHASEYEQLRVQSIASTRRPPTDVVATELQRNNLPVPWPNNAPIERAKMPPRTKEVERTLTWFSDQVAPSVAYAVRAAGTKRVREALQL